MRARLSESGCRARSSTGTFQGARGPNGRTYSPSLARADDSAEKRPPSTANVINRAKPQRIGKNDAKLKIHAFHASRAATGRSPIGITCHRGLHKTALERDQLQRAVTHPPRPDNPHIAAGTPGPSTPDQPDSRDVILLPSIPTPFHQRSSPGRKERSLTPPSPEKRTASAPRCQRHCFRSTQPIPPHILSRKGRHQRETLPAINDAPTDDAIEKERFPDHLPHSSGLPAQAPTQKARTERST